MTTSLKRWRQIGQAEFVKWTEPGQAIEGFWRGQSDGKFGPLGTIETATGRLSFPLHTALVHRVEDMPDGAEIRIVYTGKQSTKDGQRTFKAFDVFVAEDEAAQAGPTHDDNDIPF